MKLKVKEILRKYFFGWLNGEQPYENRINGLVLVVYLVEGIYIVHKFIYG